MTYKENRAFTKKKRVAIFVARTFDCHVRSGKIFRFPDEESGTTHGPAIW
jgi:hypothetical protein